MFEAAFCFLKKRNRELRVQKQAVILLVSTVFRYVNRLMNLSVDIFISAI